MLTSLIKRTWISVLLGTFFVVILLLWIPFIWRDEVEFNRGLFATEYYKTLVDIGKILFGFWLANIFFQRTQAKEFVEHFQKQWQIQKIALLDAIRTLENVPNNHNIHIKDLIEKIELSDMRLSHLSDVISSYAHKDKLGSLGVSAYEYREDLHLHIALILDSLEKGEIIMLRPLDDEIIQCIELLKVKLSA